MPFLFQSFSYEFFSQAMYLPDIERKKYEVYQKVDPFPAMTGGGRGDRAVDPVVTL